MLLINEFLTHIFKLVMLIKERELSNVNILFLLINVTNVY